MVLPAPDLSHLPEAQIEFLRNHGYSDEQIARFAPWGTTKEPKRQRPLPLLPPEEQARREAEAIRESERTLWGQ